jgi:hypothetical protein
MARLVIFDDRVRGVDLPAHAVIVGRSRKVDIPIRDRLLSRKHCTIIPATIGAENGAPGPAPPFRVIDLKSANGTYINGNRVDKCDLEFDDVIEIGSTVMVLLDTDTWRRGEGLASLRNPVKAQELVQRLSRDGEPASSRHAGSVLQTTGGLAAGRHLPEPPLSAAGGRFVEWARSRLGEDASLRDLLARHLEHRVADLLVRGAPDLRAAMEEALERVLESLPEGAREGRGEMQEAIQRAIQEAIQRAIADALRGLAPGGSDEGTPGEPPGAEGEGAPG